MNATSSFTRCCARRLAAHAARVLPPDRADWARAMRSEIDHLSRDSAALRWAAGAVAASYLERINLMRNFVFLAALVTAGLGVIEGSHLLTQYLFQQRIIDWLTATLPISLLTNDAGGYEPMGVLLTTIISAPVALVAFVVGRTLFRLVPECARAAVSAIIVADAILLAIIILVSLSLMLSGEDSLLATIPSTAIFWAIRVMFVTLPLLGLLFVNRPKSPARSVAT
jgi:hypothetical protein